MYPIKSIFIFVVPLPQAFTLLSFEETLRECIDLTVVYGENDMLTFLYDDKTRTLHPSIGDDARLENVSHFSLNQFQNYINEEARTLQIATYLDNIPLYYRTKTRNDMVDYSIMVTQLQEKGCITVEKSKNLLVNDRRRFYFPNEDDFVEVDCLGTSMCQDITDKFLNLWNSFKSGQ